MGDRRNSRSILDQLEIAEENSQSQQAYEDVHEYASNRLLAGGEEDDEDDFEDMGYEDITEIRDVKNEGSYVVGSFFQDSEATPGPRRPALGGTSFRNNSSFRGDVGDEFLSRAPSYRSVPPEDPRSPRSPKLDLLQSPGNSSLRRGRTNRVTLFDASPTTSEAGSSSNLTGGTSRGAGLVQKMLDRTDNIIGRFNGKAPSTAQTNPVQVDPTIEAVSRLGNTTNDFEQAAAAAAFVAATSGPKSRGAGLFSKGNYCLVMLTLLGISDRDGQRDLYTIDPVNVHGYPRGEGKTDQQRHGPFMFVLCVVTQVHFDEDERYYTVRRCDTGVKQRADPGFLEPITDAEAISAASRAAKRNKRNMKDGQESVVAETPSWFTRTSRSALEWWYGRFMPTYIRKRDAVKSRVMSFLDGDPGYGLNLHFSGVNFLVLCSFVFLFDDVVSLAFAPPELDRTTSIIGV